MGAVNYTPSQKAAIENRGGALLVAAAAGSGKTKVLVERLMSRVTDTENPVDIDRFLVITYTKSAAAELRSRIMDEINERLVLEPGSRHLRRQASLIYKAPISTIHSFCGGILRENAQLLGISPEFRVMEQDESEIAKLRVIEELIDERYENVDGDFAKLTDTMATGRDDSKLSQLALELHSKLNSHPSPEKWAFEQLKALEAGKNAKDASETLWGRAILNYTLSDADYWLEAFGAAVCTVECDEKLAVAYYDSFRETLDALKRFRAALDKGWDEAQSALPIPFPKLKPLRGYSTFESEDVKRVRELCKQAAGKFTEIFDAASNELLEDIGAVLPAVRGLFALALDFDKAYSAEKARRKMLDFGDLEHLAIKLLTDDSGERTDKARELSERFEEIMVDEYQDANEIQDIIFTALSKDGNNAFMVGDVKQSIYRFRLADPTIFLRKYEAFEDAENAKEGQPRRIILQDNFRSRQSVLDAVNFVFSSIMSKQFGEMDYTENERLKLGKKDFPENPDTAFELDLIEITKGDDEDEADKTEVEAAFVARRIRELVESGMTITDKDNQRRLNYGDVAILLRSVKGKAEVYTEALRRENIPYYTENGREFWSRTEVSVMLSLLSIVDNPRQDVPLISVLRSPLFGFTPDELAEVRLADKDSDFYTALCKAAVGSERFAAFLEFLSELRLGAPDMRSDAFVWHVYTKTSALSIFGAMHGGAERKANLMALLDYAVQFENAGYKGLFGFVNQLKRFSERGGETAAANSSGAGNAVTVTSIHKSKGLEYPVVFISDTGKRFNKDDTRKPLLIHSNLGVGPKRLDLERRIEYTTLPRMAIARRMTGEMLAEELRVLYVAMTRAKEKLIVTCASKTTGRMFDRLLPGAKAPVAPQILSECASMGEWLILAALLRKESSGFNGIDTEALEESRDSLWDIRHITPESCAESDADALENEAPIEDAVSVEAVEEIAKRLSFKYSHEAATKLPSKLTATGIKGRFLDREAAEEAEKLKDLPRKFAFDRPRFVEEETALTGTERGVALHLVMQYIDYKKCTSLSGVKGEIERLGRLKIISAKQAGAVEARKILAFFESELGKKVLSAKEILREFKFSVLIPAADYFPESGDEEILLQGVVDCCIEEEAELTVIDFKTDYVTKSNQQERAVSYKPQLEAYAKAMERITGKPVGKRVLYFFSTDEAVEV